MADEDGVDAGTLPHIAQCVRDVMLAVAEVTRHSTTDGYDIHPAHPLIRRACAHHMEAAIIVLAMCTVHSEDGVRFCQLLMHEAVDLVMNPEGR